MTCALRSTLAVISGCVLACSSGQDESDANPTNQDHGSAQNEGAAPDERADDDVTDSALVSEELGISDAPPADDYPTSEAEAEPPPEESLALDSASPELTEHLPDVVPDTISDLEPSETETGGCELNACGGQCGLCPGGLHCVDHYCVTPIVLDSSYTISTSLDVPFLVKFTEVTGTVRVDAPDLEQLVLPNLVAVGQSIIVSQAASLGHFEAPSLVTVGGSLLAYNTGLHVLGLPNLTTVGEHVSPGPAVLDAPTLEHAGYLEFNYLSSGVISLPSLTTVPGSLLVQKGNVTAVSVPLLSSVGDLRIRESPALASFEAPALVESRDIEIQGLEALHVFALPNLETAKGGVRVSDNPGLTAVDLPSLSAAQGVQSVMVYNNPKLQEVDLTALSAVSDLLRFADNAALGSISLPLIPTAAAIEVTGNGDLESVSFPQLKAVSYSLQFSSNDEFVWFDMPMLIKVGKLTITDNPSLPQCLAESLVAQLTATGGAPPDSLVLANRSDCTCEAKGGSILATCQ